MYDQSLGLQEEDAKLAATLGPVLGGADHHLCGGDDHLPAAQDHLHLLPPASSSHSFAAVMSSYEWIILDLDTLYWAGYYEDRDVVDEV